MLGSLLVGLDGSAFSKSAVELAISWAVPNQASVTGITVLDEPTILAGEPVPLGGSAFKEHRDSMRLIDAQKKIDSFCEDFETRTRSANVAFRTVKESGVPYKDILKVADEHDLIVLGKKTFFHFEVDSHPCDTLNRVIKQCSRPVVAVPEKIQGGNSVLIAYDGSIQASRSLQLFQLMSLGMKGTVNILTIDKNYDQARDICRQAVHFLEHHKVKAEAHPVASTAFEADLVLEHCEKFNAGLVIMGAYGQSVIKEFFFGSVTKRILEETKVPLFLYN